MEASKTMSQRAKRVSGSSNPDRWMAEIVYVNGEQQTLAFEELEDLDEIVELGPDWHTIDRIVITLNRPALALNRPA
jgi:hypothetical protein